jgi:hypothetical protein
MEEREATIVSASNLKLRDEQDGMEHQFINPANITLTDGAIAIYVSITTPNKVVRIIKEIKH